MDFMHVPKTTCPKAPAVESSEVEAISKKDFMLHYSQKVLMIHRTVVSLKHDIMADVQKLKTKKTKQSKHRLPPCSLQPAYFKHTGSWMCILMQRFLFPAVATKGRGRKPFGSYTGLPCIYEQEAVMQR